jgi:hypothetical protein
MNSTSMSEWFSNQSNMNTVNIAQQALSLFFGILIFLRTYDFQSMLSSVRERRLKAQKEKERNKILKFKKLMELAKSGEVDIDKFTLSNNDEDDDESEEKKVDKVMKVTRKKVKAINIV